MDLDRTPIKNEEATPLLSDSEDDTSPPKKRVKHVSDFDSTKQKRVFDLDLGLPTHNPVIGYRWNLKFEFLHYIPEHPEVFQDIVTTCREEITSLKNARNKANNFFEREFVAVLDFLYQQKPTCRDTSVVLETIRNGQKRVNDDICKADEMLPSFQSDVENYLRYKEDKLLKHNVATDLYFKKIEQLAKTHNADKAIKNLMCKDFSYERVKRLSGLTPRDISGFRLFLHWEQINFDIEAYNEDEEKFGSIEMSDWLKANKISLGKLHSLREDLEKANAKIREHASKYGNELFGHMNCLLCCLETAGVQLRIMRQQLELLYEKDIIAKGYDEMFLRDWGMAEKPRMFAGF